MVVLVDSVRGLLFLLNVAHVDFHAQPETILVIDLIVVQLLVMVQRRVVVQLVELGDSDCSSSSSSSSGPS